MVLHFLSSTDMDEDSDELGESEEPKSFDELHEIFHDMYAERDDDGWIEISGRGAGAGEILYKQAMAQAIAEGRGEELPDSWGVEGITLVRLMNEILDKFEEAEEYDDAKEWEIRYMISDEFVLFFTLANEIVQSLAGEIINEELFEEDLQSDSSLGVARELPQQAKEDLLFYSGIIDNGVKGEMANVRKTRNKLIHDLRNRQYLSDIESIESRMVRTTNVINELHSVMYGHELFGDEL